MKISNAHARLALPLWLIAATSLAVGFSSCKRHSSGGSTITRAELKQLMASQGRVEDLEKKASDHFPGKGYSFSANHPTTDTADPLKSLMAAPTMFICAGVADVKEAIEVDRELRALFTHGELDGMKVCSDFPVSGSNSVLVGSDQLGSDLSFLSPQPDRPLIMHHFYSRDDPPQLLPVKLRDDYAFMIFNIGTLENPQLEVLVGLRKEQKIYRLRQWEAVDGILSEIPEGSAISCYGKCLTPTFYGLPDDTWDKMMGLIKKHKLTYDLENDSITCDCSQH